MHPLLVLLQQDQPDWNAIRGALLHDSTPVNNHRFWRDILNFVCSKQAPLRVVQLVVQKYPDAVKQKDNIGELPLHVACKTNQSFEVIDLLVQAYPVALKKKNSNGHLPLHMACGSRQSFQVIDLLVRQYARALKQKDHAGFLPLHMACHCQSFEVIDFLVQAYPDAVQQKDDHGNIPLHNACIFNKSFEVIDLFVQAYPDAVKQKDYHGDLPLHKACGKNQSFEVIDWLVQQYPGALMEKNSYGNLPLQVACGNNQSFEVIDLLVRQYHDAVKQKDNEGDLPLHSACANKQSFKVIQLLVRQYPDAVKQKDNDSCLPLHNACGTNQSFEVIQLLVQQHPDAVKERESTGCHTPLDIAKSRVDEGTLDFKIVEWLESIESGLEGSSPLARTDDVEMPSSPTGLSPLCDEEPDGPSHLPAAKRDDGLPSALFADTHLAQQSAAASNEPESIAKFLLDAGSAIHIAMTKKGLHDITACHKAVDRANKRSYVTELGVRKIRPVGGSTIISMSDTHVLEDSLHNVISLCALLEKGCEVVEYNMQKMVVQLPKPSRADDIMTFVLEEDGLLYMTAQLIDDEAEKVNAKAIMSDEESHADDEGGKDKDGDDNDEDSGDGDSKPKEKKPEQAEDVAGRNV